MRVDLYPTALNIPADEQLAGRAAVVIDVLRATSTIVTALQNGAAAVLPVLTPEEAFQSAAGWPDGTYLLGGERNSVRIPGFDLGNSPLEYTPDRVEGRSILFTTTNGTRAIRGAAGAERVFIAAFLNAPAVAEQLMAAGRDVAVCCAGTRDQFSLEDTVCAGAIVTFLRRLGAEVELNDLGQVAADLFERNEGRVAELLLQSEHGRSLLKLGLERDLRYCAQMGVSALVPQYREGRVVLPQRD